MTTLRDIPGSCILARLDADTLIAVPIGDKAESAARRWMQGRPQPGDEAALRAWLAEHPQYEITQEPEPEEALAPVRLPSRGQLELWPAA